MTNHMTSALAFAARRRTVMAQGELARQKRTNGASVAAYSAAREGGSEATALGLVHSSTSGQATLKPARMSLEIDPLQARAQRLRKSVITSARLHDQEAQKGSRRGAWYFLTLTYRNGIDSSPRDVSDVLKQFRRFFNRAKSRAARWHGESFRYVWVGELTQALKPHYHVMLWVPKGMFFGKPDQKGWWPHGLTQIEKARNCVGYLAKYASKFTSAVADAFPRGFRTHGCGGLNDESRRELRWWKASKEAREVLGVDADIRKTKGGYFDKLTGAFWPSPWRVTFLFGRVIAWKLIT